MNIAEAYDYDYLVFPRETYQPTLWAEAHYRQTSGTSW